jgi:hypothetical protein
VLCVAGLVTAGCHEGAEYPAGRVGPGGAEGWPGPVDQPGAVLRYRHVIGAQSEWARTGPAKTVAVSRL